LDEEDAKTARGQHRIRGQIQLLVALLPVIVTALFVLTNFATQEATKRASLARVAERAQELLRLQLDQQAESLLAAIDSLAASPSLQRALENGDDAAFAHGLRPLFDRLKDQHGVSHFYVTLPDRSSFLKLDGNGRSGQVVDRLDLFDTAENGAPPYGLDLGALGTLTLRVVSPWRDSQGRLLGFIELGEDVAPLIEANHRVLGLELLVLVRKEFLDRDKWEEGERLAGRSGSWDELGSSVAVAQTLHSIPTSLGLMLEDGSRAREVVISMEKGRHVFTLSVRPLLDIAQKPIGEIVLLRDVTEVNGDFARTQIALVLLGSVVTLAGFLWCRRLLGGLGQADGAAK
jgi:hypothetical protein